MDVNLCERLAQLATNGDAICLVFCSMFINRVCGFFEEYNQRYKCLRQRNAFQNMLSVLLLCIFLSVTSAENLKYVQAIWRHGDRAPAKLPYPKDIYGEANWPRGWGHLTNVGMLELRELGQFFRTKYCIGKQSFIEKDFNASEVRINVYILSTDSERALTSAQALLNGMFPPQENFVWNKGVNWQPIPVHAFGPQEPNPLLRPTSYKCPAYVKLANEINAPLKQELLKNNTEFIKFVQEKTGIPDSKSLVSVIGKLVDLNREIKHNLSQPTWVHKEWPQYGHNTTVQIITEMKRRERMSEFEDERLAKFRGGFLLGDFLSRAQSVVKNTKEESNIMRLYSSHDGTVSALLSVLNVSDRQLVPYAGCVIMEVVEDKNEFYIKLYYRKNKELLPLTVPGCESHKCRFETFYNILSPKAIFDEEELKEMCSQNATIARTESNSAPLSAFGASLMLALPALVW
uniref:Prostatic acid phosphatase n=1 Tax=Steinernema glaseri TaxID=37863 RepID=A0A1I7XWI1_9BILA